MEKNRSNLCLNCQQDKSHHAPGCDLDDSPAAWLKHQWRDNPNQSVWRDFRKDDLGNPVLGSWMQRERENAVELNGSTIAAFPAASSGFIAGE
jgi:hypothetical protein